MASHNKPGQATTPKFTAEMRDRQARNKDPYTGGPVRTSSPNEEGSSSSSARKQPKYAYIPLACHLSIYRMH